ncbi:MAG: hypothetical protein WA324_00870 [Bryobacteraceae bacterium]
MRFHTLTTILTLVGALGLGYAQTEMNSVISTTSPLQIPERTLQPGSYTLTLEDAMSDRAILKISASDGAHSLVLVVPQTTWPYKDGPTLKYWPADASNPRALRAWYSESSGHWYELVYPKGEAVELAKRTTDPVIAVDPKADKIVGKNLTADDMKVVTLWLLSPYKLSSGKVDLKAGHYVSPTAAPKELAQNTRPPRKLPKTATNNPTIGLIGLLALFASVVIRDPRKQRTASV